MLFGSLITFSEVNISDFKAFSDDSADYHSLFLACFGDADSYFIHISVVGFLFLILWILLLAFFSLIKVRGRFNVGQQSDSIFSLSLGELSQSILSCYRPSLLFEILLRPWNIGKIGLLSFYLVLDNWYVIIGNFLEFTTEAVRWSG